MKKIGVQKDLPKGKMYSKRNRIGPLNEEVKRQAIIANCF